MGLPELSFSLQKAAQTVAARVSAGNVALILRDDGRQVKLGRAVTSKVTLSGTEPALLKKIKMAAAVDLIRYYGITTVEDEYLGKCANTYDNKCILLTALRGFLSDLETQSVLVAGKKLTGVSVTGTVRLYNATSRLIELEGAAIRAGTDLRHTIISNLDDPDNPDNQRISVTGVSFDDLTLADWEAAKLGTIEAPFTAESYEILDS